MSRAPEIPSNAEITLTIATLMPIARNKMLNSRPMNKTMKGEIIQRTAFLVVFFELITVVFFI